LALGLEKQKEKFQKEKKKKRILWKLLLSADVKRDVNKRCDKKSNKYVNFNVFSGFQ
jgi:hypothetical protein